MEITPQPQPTPDDELIEQTDLTLLLDREFVRYTRYADAHFDRLAAELRIGAHESLARDRALADALITLGQHVGTIEANQGTIIDMQQSMLTSMQDMQGVMQSMQATLGDIQHEMRAGFAGLGGQLDTLISHVERLERQADAPDTDAS